ncbi:hypothetical protein [Variovorax sp. ZT5P49]
MIFELRTYFHRPGSIADAPRRFEMLAPGHCELAFITTGKLP